MYTTIMSRQDWVKELWYIDVLAGTGTTRIDDSDDVIISSPFIAYFIGSSAFSKYIFIEKNKQSYDALNQRAQKYMGKSANVLYGDSNKIVNNIVSKIRNNKKTIHSLVFIDNEGMDINWSTIEQLISILSDIIIVFQTREVNRVFGAAKKALSGELPSKGHIDRMNQYFGNSSWRKASNENDLVKIYMHNLRRAFIKHRKKQPYLSEIRVGQYNYYYDVILLCRQGDYTRAWEYLKERIYWKDPDIVKNVLDILKGRQKELDIFIELQKGLEELEEDENDLKNKHLTLNHFMD